MNNPQVFITGINGFVGQKKLSVMSYGLWVVGYELGYRARLAMTDCRAVLR
jgi:hypothetical protein